MTTIRQLEIRRIYSASPIRAAATGPATPRPVGVSRLGIATLIVAAAWIYAAWFPADRFMIASLFRTQLNQPPAASGVDLSVLLQRPSQDSEGPAPPEGTEPAASRGDAEPASISPQAPDAELVAEAMATFKHLYGDMACWLAVMTATGCYLALCAGSSITLTPVVDDARRRQLVLAAACAVLLSILLALGLWRENLKLLGLVQVPKPVVEVLLVSSVAFCSWVLLVTVSSRTAGWVAVVAAVGLLIAGVWTWQTYGRGYPTVAPRFAALCGMVVAVLAGASACHRSFQLYGYAILAMLGATALTAVAIKYADHFGGFQNHSPPLTTYAFIAIAQLSYALVLAIVQGVLSRRLAAS
ncbi:MAG: hypothetical protein ACE5GE_12200 [Phycisphaerae bacterium]